MEYESVQEAALRLGVTVRAVQKWAKEGKIPGAVKVGRDWRIPRDTAAVEEDDHSAHTHVVLPLLNSSFEPGSCMSYINSISDEDDRKIALGEYYYFSGQGQKAAHTVEKYLTSSDIALQFSAVILTCFSNLDVGAPQISNHMLGIVREKLLTLSSEKDPVKYASVVLVAAASATLLHLPTGNLPPLEDYVRFLPEGLRLFACYVMAHQAYLEGNYERCLTTAKIALAVCPAKYPIGEIYLHMIIIMALMNQMRSEEARTHMSLAWELARKDNFLQPFAEHHGLLQGMIESFFKNDDPELYRRITAITYSFSSGWRLLHNPMTNQMVADNLTTTEFAIAMLYSKGWTAMEVADYMKISERMVKKHIAEVYGKLGISSKRELRRYMLP